MLLEKPRDFLNHFFHLGRDIVAVLPTVGQPFMQVERCFNARQP